MTSNHDFALSYEQIRQQAQTLDDLAQWFEANPQAFRGIHTSLPQTTLRVGMHAESTSKMAKFRNTGVLEVRVNITFELDIQLHPALEGTASNTPTSPLFDTADPVEFNHRYTFQLPLKDWPCATVYLVQAFMQSGSMYDGRDWMMDVRCKLNEVLALHFPGHTLEKLHELHQAGLLPLNQDEELDMNGLATLLFNRCPTTPSIPNDIAP